MPGPAVYHYTVFGVTLQSEDIRFVACVVTSGRGHIVCRVCAVLSAPPQCIGIVHVALVGVAPLGAVHSCCGQCGMWLVDLLVQCGSNMRTCLQRPAAHRMAHNYNVTCRIAVGASEFPSLAKMLLDSSVVMSA